MSASAVTAAGLLSALAFTWSGLVDRVVKQPYLDEFFHIPQAQQYCLGHYDHWDSKITTPAGLYLVAAGLKGVLGCDITTLRRESMLCLFALFATLLLLLRGRQCAHIALNIVLLPPLFFFSGLYYTDVASTLSVMICYTYLERSETHPQLVKEVLTFILGATSLWFRQTNIFWVTIYPAATTLLGILDQGHDVIKASMYTGAAGFGDSWTSIVKTAWKHRVVYDLDNGAADLEDYLKCALTIIVCLLRSTTNIKDTVKNLRPLWPFLSLIACFALFILKNGSVVLGDKSNHVATLHLPQMLYIWPYILFFSWPLLLPQLLGLLVGVLNHIPALRELAIVRRHAHHAKLPGLRYLFLFSSFAGLAVLYNTIVHPFTLADNRHYTFYVFRLLMQPWWIRYAAILVYAISAWVCIQALDGGRRKHTSGPDAKIATTSAILIWTATSALQLVTAPLVEPRYFILPWIFYIVCLSSTPTISKANGLLWLQTAWLILINAGTGYMFLAKPFRWPSEPDALQRFMW